MVICWYFAFVLYITLCSRDIAVGGMSRRNLTPVTDIVRAVKLFDVEKLLQFLGNFLLFIPVGAILAHGLKVRKVYAWTPVFCFGISVLIEASQWILKIGVCDINDVILNTLGGVWGWLLHEKYRMKRGRISTLVLVLPFALCIGIGLGYLLTPYGTSKYDVTRKNEVQAENISFSTVYQNIPIPEEKGVYKVPVQSKATADDTMRAIFDYLGAEIAEYLPYDTCCVCYSTGRTFCLWYYYQDRHFRLENYTYNITDYIDCGSMSSILAFFSGIGIDLPEGMEYTEEEDAVTVTANFSVMEDSLYEGSIVITKTDDFIEKLEFGIKQLSFQTSAYLLTKEQIAQRLISGDFYCMGTGEINTMHCKEIELFYELDSKNYYRPYFRIPAIVDGKEKAIIMDAIA